MQGLSIPKVVLFSIFWAFLYLLPQNIFAGLDPPHDGSQNVTCISCHDLASSDSNHLPLLDHTPVAGDLDDTIPNDLCWSCHLDINRVGEECIIDATHSSQTTSITHGNWTVECRVCHNQHTQEQPGGKYIRATINLANIRYAGTTPSKNGIRSIYYAGTTDMADGDGTYDGICEVCHTRTSHFTNNGSAVDQNHGGRQGSNCTNCHRHGKGFKQGEVCLDCHDITVNDRAAIGSQFTANSHHIQGMTANSQQCYICHWEGDSTGKFTAYHSSMPGAAVDLVIYGSNSRPLPGDYAGNVVLYTPGVSSPQILNTHCLGCHDDDTKGEDVFGDGNSPDMYAWDGASIDARYSQSSPTDITTWGKYTSTTNAAKKNIAKAYSAHGNAALNEEGWDRSNGVDGLITDTSGSVQVACFDCHNAHGSTVEGVTTSYPNPNTDNGGLLKDTTATKGGYTVTYRPMQGGSEDDRNPYNPGAALCFDCHLTADAAGTGKPWGYRSSYGGDQAVMGYWDSPYLGLDTFGPQQRYAFKFTQHQGGHLWASSRATLDPSDPLDTADTGLKTVPVNPINGLCTPCHDPHGVSPEALGSCSDPSYDRKSDCLANAGAGAWTSFQEYGVPLLKGTWLTSPYKEDTAPPGLGAGTAFTTGLPVHIDQNTFGASINSSVTPIGQTPAQFAGLCLQCHPKDSLTDVTPSATHEWKSKDRVHEAVKGWKTAGGTVQHNYSCSKCHTPHNYRLPRLMVTNCLNNTHKGRRGENPAPVLNGSGSGYEDWDAVCSGLSDDLGFCYPEWDTTGSGTGSGQFPSKYSSSGRHAPGNLNVKCHEDNAADQSWNNVTPWSDNSPAPPQFPNLIPEPDYACVSASCNASLGWYATTTPDGHSLEYRIEVDDDADFGSVQHTSAWSTSTVAFVSLPTAFNGKSWYWHVQARDAVDTSQVSAWSSPDDFLVSYELPQPNRTPEPDIECGSNCQVTLQWSGITIIDGDATEYSVVIDDNSDFSSPEYETTGWISGLTFDVTLPTESTWYWHVQARDSVHATKVSPWSVTDGFSLTARPARPTLILEPDMRCAPNCDATLAWNPVTAPDGDPVEYLVQVDTVYHGYVDWSIYGDPDFQQSGWISATSWDVTVPTDKGWYWHVWARDAVHPSLTSAWSANDLFLAIGDPAAPIPVDEPDIVCASGACLDITLQWNAVFPLDGDAIEYYVQVNDSADFSGAVLYETPAWTTDISWTVSVTTEKVYYWRVQARDSGHPATWISDWSTTDQFTVAQSDPPPAPTGLTAPATYDSDVSNVVNLSWNAVTDPNGDPVQYQVIVSSSATFSTITYNSGWITATNWNATVSSCGVWYWEVRARDAAHVLATSPWTVAASFFYDNSANCDTSCPVLFTWDGSIFAFESDLYPAGKLGNLEPNGFRKPNPHDYYLLKNNPVPNSDRYELRLVEERREANYFDRLTLYAVDFPANRDLFAERLHVSLGTYVEPVDVLHTTAKELQAPLSATRVETGEDVTALITQPDDTYVVLGNDRDLDFGWQTLEIDLGDLSGAAMIKLIIDGQTAFPITHEGHMKASLEPRKSSLQVLDGSGNWVGVPMKTRSMVPREDGGKIIVDITDIFKTSTYKIRIGYFYKTYIRSIMFDTTMDEQVTIQEAALANARLLAHGHDKKYGGEVGGYVYGDINNPAPEFLPGDYTRYGNIRPLLTRTDDKFAIFGSGDEVTLSFDATGDVPQGAARKFLLYSNGYYKSLSNDNVPHTVEPLPFAAMSNFPYDPAAEKYPDDAEHQQYLINYNTRTQ